MKIANPVIRYYHSPDVSETDVSDRESSIESALELGGFFVNGILDGGDIDDVGMNTTVFECDFARWTGVE